MDGEWIAFASDRRGSFDSWTYSTRTGALHRVTEQRHDIIVAEGVPGIAGRARK
jgi:hypothetical protein